jgi:alkyl hydroperoxide reductase subunit AhpC
MSESYYNRPMVLHVEEFTLGEWYPVLESERGSVEAAVKVAQSRTPVRQWRVVDAGGNIHEAGAPSKDQGRNVDDSIHIQEAFDYASDVEKGRVHIGENERRARLEASMRND